MSQSDAVSLIPGKILVPIDFSASSHQALEAATEYAVKFGSELYLLHVVPELTNVQLPEGVAESSIVDSARKTAQDHFALSVSSLSAKGLRVTSSVEVASDVAACILDVIEREHAELVVLSTHGLSGWYPQVFGSIAEKLVRLVHCPMVLLRTPKPETTAKVPFGRMMEWW